MSCDTQSSVWLANCSCTLPDNSFWTRGNLPTVRSRVQVYYKLYTIRHSASRIIIQRLHQPAPNIWKDLLKNFIPLSTFMFMYINVKFTISSIFSSICSNPNSQSMLKPTVISITELEFHGWRCFIKGTVCGSWSHFIKMFGEVSSVVPHRSVGSEKQIS